MKIAVIGSPGSGKSTLSLTLHKLLDFPLYHLDQYYWKPGWQRPDCKEFEKKHQQLCDKDTWIIEGSVRCLDYRIKKADVIILLDISRLTCLYRIFKRTCSYFGTVRCSSAQGCLERVPSLEFLRYIWNFNNKERPKILDIIATYGTTKKIFVIRNSTELNQTIKKLASKLLD